MDLVPWTAKRLIGLLPVLEDAVRRGVRVTVFVRDPYDTGQKKQTELVKQLRKVVPTVVSVNVMHQKIVVIDEHTVLLGSLNSLSRSRSREVMLTIKGGYFAPQNPCSRARGGLRETSPVRCVQGG